MKQKADNFIRYLRIWSLTLLAWIQVSFASRFGVLLFLTGKIIRFVFFLLILILVTNKVQILAGYNLWQMVFFFLTFNLIDSTSQFLYRQVYRFRPLIVTGDFDLVLVKPVNPLFMVLLGGADIMDLFMLVPLGGAVVYVAATGGWLTAGSVASFILLAFNALVIATAFHIAVLAFGILTTAVDNTIMIYRDLTGMARIPVDFYAEPIRGILTFAIPVGIMMTVPAKAMMGLLEPSFLAWSLVTGVIFFFLALRFWRFALTRYSSASS